MVLRIDPDVPMVWRSPHDLQLGVDRAPIILEALDPVDERLISALQVGTTRTALSVIGDAGLAEREALERRLDLLLERLGPALARSPVSASPALVLGEGRLAQALAGALRERGHVPDGGPLGLAVLVAAWVITPADAATWLGRDIPHLPVVLSDGTVTVGPVVRPGVAPCLYCVQRARADADLAWPAIASQLLGRSAPNLDAASLAQAVALASRIALAELAASPDAAGDALRVPGRQWVLDTGSGEVTERDWPPHPDCRCAARPGSDWARDVVTLTQRIPRARPATRTGRPRTASEPAGPE